MRWLTKVPAVAVAVVVAMLVAVQEAGAARILMLQSTSPSSHTNFFMAIAENLARRNHSVTFVTGNKLPRPGPNIREVFVPDINVFNEVPNLFKTSSSKLTWHLMPLMIAACSKALAYDKVQSTLKEEFDLVMMSFVATECFLSHIHERKMPFIYMCPNVPMPSFSDLSGTPPFPSLMADFNIDLEYPLTFTGRMTSTLSSLIMSAAMNLLLAREDAECRARKLCPEDMPSMKEIQLNNSLFITNSVRTMENPTLPYTPTVVHAGGIHCRPAEPLTEDLQQWVDGAGGNGFIFFSLGSLIKSSTLADEYRKVLLEVFGSLQQRVLWKWDEDTMEGLPSNVRLSKWLPQQDILGHPQLRLFITHGGMLSTQEATYHGVPVLGMPVAVDQHINMRAVQREGWGRVLRWQDLSYDSLRGHILEMMDDSRSCCKIDCGTCTSIPV